MILPRTFYIKCDYKHFEIFLTITLKFSSHAINSFLILISTLYPYILKFHIVSFFVWNHCPKQGWAAHGHVYEIHNLCSPSLKLTDFSQDWWSRQWADELYMFERLQQTQKRAPLSHWVTQLIQKCNITELGFLKIILFPAHLKYD